MSRKCLLGSVLKIHRIENTKSIGLKNKNLSDWNGKINRVGVVKSIGLVYNGTRGEHL